MKSLSGLKKRSRKFLPLILSMKFDKLKNNMPFFRNFLQIQVFIQVGGQNGMQCYQEGHFGIC